jgi:hypothetical protein
MFSDWGPCEDECCLSDLNMDGNVGAAALLLLLGHWE